jgi:hypothetical protein
MVKRLPAAARALYEHGQVPFGFFLPYIFRQSLRAQTDFALILAEI